MIRENTVLILGAGASCHLGYPLGSGLKVRFADFLEQTPDARYLGKELRESGALSIDDFILRKYEAGGSAKREGRTLHHYLTKCFSSIERDEVVPKIGDDSGWGWYESLWERLSVDAGSLADFRENNLKVITYNYDLSLDVFLRRKFFQDFKELLISATPPEPNPGQMMFSLMDEVITDACPVLHVYGSFYDEAILDYPEYPEHFFNTSWVLQLPNGEPWRESARFGNTIEREVATCGNGPLTSEKQNQIDDWLSSAESVFFVGFGFHEPNVKILEPGFPTAASSEVFLFDYDKSLSTRRVERSLKDTLRRETKGYKTVLGSDMDLSQFVRDNIA